MSERKKSISAGIGAVLGTLSDGGVCPADRTEIRVHTLNDNDDKETTLYRLQKGTVRSKSRDPSLAIKWLVALKHYVIQ